MEKRYGICKKLGDAVNPALGQRTISKPIAWNQPWDFEFVN